MKITAVISPCRTWRYKLDRIWNENCEPLVWVMLNPSTADESRDDATIRKCIGFSINWGFGGIEIYNLFALRQRNPHSLATAPDPVGPENNSYLRSIPSSRSIMVAWGAFPLRLGVRDRDVLEILRERKLECLGFTAAGYPKHPLYIPYKKTRETFDIRP